MISLKPFFMRALKVKLTVYAQVELHPDEAVNAMPPGPRAAILHPLHLAPPVSVLVQELSPEEQILRINNAVHLIGAAPIKIKQSEIARGGEGVYGAVAAPGKYSSMLGVERNPIALWKYGRWPAMKESGIRRDAGAHDAMSYNKRTL